MARKGMDTPILAEPAPKSSASFRFHKKHGKMMPEGLKVGKRHRFRIGGKLTGIRSDEYGHSLDIDLDDLQPEMGDDPPRSLTQAIKRRHMRSGRYT